MMIWIIAVVACLSSLLTLISGFGLGTILMPVFGLFFPLPVAVALTGIVHLLNNIFKLSLLGTSASREMVFRFGIPSVIGGAAGALLLGYLDHLEPLFSYKMGDGLYHVSPLGFVISIVMIFFALMEIVPALKALNFTRRFLTAGGLLSGFFGGLSGHQGALRSAFLVNAGLSKESYIATGVVIACMVDLTRLPVYFTSFIGENLWDQWHVLLAATLSAFTGAWMGNRFMKKITLEAVQKLTAVMIIAIAVLLGMGIR